MRLRELKYPILRQSIFGLSGHPPISRSRHWSYIIANEIVSGRSDEDIYYDCSGGMFEVDQFILSDTPWLRRFLSRADNFFILRPKRKYHYASLDAELRLVRQFTLAEFCNHIRDFSLSHRDWWTEYATERDFQSMFDGCTTFEEAMGRIISLEARKLPKAPKGGSTKMVDHRTIREPTWF
jgi:hypothetical protein